MGVPQGNSLSKTNKLRKRQKRLDLIIIYNMWKPEAIYVLNCKEAAEWIMAFLRQSITKFYYIYTLK